MLSIAYPIRTEETIPYTKNRIKQNNTKISKQHAATNNTRTGAKKIRYSPNEVCATQLLVQFFLAIAKTRFQLIKVFGIANPDS